MAIFLNPDNANFNEAVHSKIYVDKTGLIEYTNSVLSTTAKFICNSRPRRFGKSMTADMLCAYYSKGCESRELFQPYTISSCSTFEKYINQYDVIHIDVQWCKDQVENINDIVNYIKESCMHELQNEYSNIDYKIRGHINYSENELGLLGRKCPICGYKYGHGWLKEEIPQDVIDFLTNLPKSNKVPAWI